MARKSVPIGICLTESTIQRLDALAHRYGWSRSAVVTRLVDFYGRMSQFQEGKVNTSDVFEAIEVGLFHVTSGVKVSEPKAKVSRPSKPSKKGVDVAKKARVSKKGGA